MDVDTSDDEADYDVEAEEEDMEKDFKGLNITTEYCPNLPLMDELQKLAHLFPELDDFEVQSGTKFAESVLSPREGEIWFLYFVNKI